ncbi:putative disease resistance protein RGA1 [Zingiber officinale]|uniref:Uncharacterized protein n=1 Tax=Zingiber officinale TaxID=94328 RepID=A0A8J5CAX5_ZINOF|nr:putative disease resistance protein RGA1 [Zingiber officinale]XP_042447050.1 putative disease resistance protein RGA1 [Zingiber officinale]XP_042447051.1 putative disease resistance protein RGA1 [Zingiber officinale]KAG6469924.1 hypothetical protein ZIOFF_070859 [Zingiber officinale]
MKNDSFSRFASKIDDLFRLLAAETIELSDVAARSSPEVPQKELKDIKAILKNIKGLLYDSGRQIREDAIKLRLKEFQDLVIEVEDFVDDYQYKKFQREAEFRSLHGATSDSVDDLPRSRALSGRRLLERNRRNRASSHRKKPVATEGSLGGVTMRRTTHSPPLYIDGERPCTIDPDPVRQSQIDESFVNQAESFGSAFLPWIYGSSDSSFVPSLRTDGNFVNQVLVHWTAHLNKPVEIEVPLNIVVRIEVMKRTIDDLLAQRQKAQKCSSHLLLISQEKQDPKKLQRVAEFLLAESLKSDQDLSYLPEDSIRGSKQYQAHDVTKEIYGRNSDREHIISWLLLGTNSRFSLFEDERSRNKFSAISIVGEAGVGKTALAKEVYNDPLVCKYFNSRVWLHFTEESDAVSFSKAFFVSITGKSCDGKEPVHLQSVMKEELKGKKLLLVLDDLQDLNLRLWEYLQAPLAGVRMAKFIITSRTELEASKLRGIESYPLGCLPLDLSWDLFQHCAFREDSSHPPELIEIGKHIVQKCWGLPLAVKTLGSLLGYQMDRQIWRGVLESELWELQETETDISPALQLSYYLLPTYLKPCFLYCSLFPRGYKFDKYELVRLWMAQGYIQHEDEDYQSLETVGCNYFHELQMLTIFDRSWDGTFTIHDLLYDVSKYMSNGECSSLPNVKMYKDSGKIHQLYVTSSKGTNELQSSNANLTLQSLYKSLGAFPPNDILTMALIESVQGIRALELTCHGDSSIAETTQEEALNEVNASSVSNLRFIHLRYLRICDRFIEVLPAAVCELYNLQTLNLDKCLKLRELPSDIGKLVNLRYLGLSEANIEKLPKSVYQLQKLQSLKVDYCRNLKELPYNIGNLVNLCHLGLSGTSIKRLPRSVHRLSKLSTLKLDQCKILMELPSSIGNLVNLRHVTACRTKITKLPESICSLFNLLTLDLAYSNLSELPNDIGNLSNLNYLALSYTNISILPESLCYLSRLCTLKLNGCTNLSQLPSGIGALKTLSHLVVSGINIEQLPESVCQLLNLEVLVMDGCRRFFSLPDGIGYLTKLHQLKLSDTEIQELPESIGQLSNLQNLDLNGCQRLSKLPESIGYLSELSNLEVTETKIKTLPASFCQLSNLKVLNLNGNLDLQELPSGIENLANLCQLELSEVGIEVLPRCIVRLTNLEKLTFEHKKKPFENYQL